MSHKAFVLVVVLLAGLLWPTIVLAQNPNTCLPSCYAWNQAPAGGNGTAMSPWRWNKSADPDASSLRNLVLNAVQGKRNSGTLEVIDCNNARPPKCTATLYSYTRAGGKAVTDVGEVPVPEVGVPIPFHYILGLGGLGALLLIGAGFILRRKTRQLT